MRWSAFAVAAFAAALVSSCAMLSAEAPLFTPADQDPAFALAEGLWVAKEAGCDVDPQRSKPEQKSCLDWARITRASNGSWVVSSEGEDDDPMHIVIAAAAPRGSRALAPLYVAESVNPKSGDINYGALVPRGDLSEGVKRLAITGVACDVVTDDTPIAGITVTRDDGPTGGKVLRCTATTQAAVREATRRAVIAELTTLGENELMFVRK